MYLYRFPGIRAGLSLAAAAGLAAGTAAAQPHLVPVLNNPMLASVGVQNTRASPAGPSHLNINHTCLGKPHGRCLDAPRLHDIGRASCREKVDHVISNTVVTASINQNTTSPKT